MMMEVLRVFVFALICFEFHCNAFNIDVSHARILEGPKKSMFGFTSIYHHTGRHIKLIVGAPKAEGKGSIRSGATFTCDSSPSNNSCQLDYADFPDRSGFSSDAEMYGSVITKAGSSTPLVCAPRFRDDFYTIGRCATHSDSFNLNIYPKYRGQSGYVRTVTDTMGGQIVLYWNAMGEWGMSGDTLEDGNVLLGRPGFMDYRGGVVIVKDLKEVVGNIPTDLSIPPHSYIGYSVAAGNFCGRNKLCFAAGGPRKENGRVLIYRYRKGSDQYVVRQRLFGDQIWSYFGATLCSADVNSDGLDDLLVGAPYYTELDKGGNSDKLIFKDEGRVTVYLNIRHPHTRQRMRLVKSITLAGSNIHDARFGTAITNIGDINGDGYTDIAIGAPFESDGQGAVYIYHGGHGGLKPAVQQKIMGRDVSSTMTSFGWSISKSYDIDNNHYPDVAIGAYKSDAIVILRTRPIIDLHVTMTTDPKLIKQDRRFCQRGSTSNACFKIKLCFLYTGQGLPKTLRFNFTLTTDTNKQQDNKRVLLSNKKGYKDTVSRRISLLTGEEKCRNFTAETIENKKNADPFNLVRLEAKYDLLQTPDPNSDLRPVLNLTDKRVVIRDTAFQLECGPNNECESDLVLQLQSRVIHEKYDVFRPELNTSIVFNVTKSVVIEATVVNKGEDAFATVVQIIWTGSIYFQRSETSLDQPITCDIESGEITPHDSETECRVSFPLTKHGSFKFKLHFLTDDVDLGVLSASAKVNITLKTGNTELVPVDNSASVSIPMVIDAHTIINGLADPDKIYIEIDRPSRPSLYLTHMFVVKNKGPSFLPSTDVLVELPYMASDSSRLTKDLHVTISHEDGTSMACWARDRQDSGSQQSPLPMKQTKAKLMQASTRGSVTEPSRTQRRSPAKRVDSESTTGSELNLDCASYRCKEFLCPLEQLPAGESAVITAAIAVSVAQLPVNQETLQLKYFSAATVISPSHPSFYPWNGSVTYQSMTRIHPLRAPKLNLFIIIGSAAGGVLLIIIITIGLWKCGFFRREKRYKVQEWIDNQKTSDERPISTPEDALSDPTEDSNID